MQIPTGWKFYVTIIGVLGAASVMAQVGEDLAMKNYPIPSPVPTAMGDADPLGIFSGTPLPVNPLADPRDPLGLFTSPTPDTLDQALNDVRRANPTPYYGLIKGNMADHGGSPTLRRGYVPKQYDDPYTTSDESNDQPRGYYGTTSGEACNQDTGRCYTLDVDRSGDEVERIYFPKGGWLDVYDSECDGTTCEVTDEEGTTWEIETDE